MRNAFWIAVDAALGAAPGTWGWCLGLFLLLVTPFQVGLTDGPAARLPLWGEAGGLRGTLLMFGCWPAISAAGICVDGVLARRLRGEMEPLLASPVTSREIVFGCALPVLVVSLVAPIVTAPIARLGYVLLAPAPAPPVAAEFLRACLATWGAGAWMSGVLVDASLRATDSASLAARTFLCGCLPLLACDVACLGARVAGWRAAPVVVDVVTIAAGLILLDHTARRLDREALLGRV